MLSNNMRLKVQAIWTQRTGIVGAPASTDVTFANACRDLDQMESYQRYSLCIWTSLCLCESIDFLATRNTTQRTCLQISMINGKKSSTIRDTQGLVSLAQARQCSYVKNSTMGDGHRAPSTSFSLELVAKYLIFLTSFLYSLSCFTLHIHTKDKPSRR